MNKEELLKRLDALGKMLYEKCGTDSYEARCYLHDTKELIKQGQELPISNVVGSEAELLALAEYMCKHQNNLDGKTAKDYLQEFLSQ